MRDCESHESASCCVPSPDHPARTSQTPPVASVVQRAVVAPEFRSPGIALNGGTFLMGSDYAEGFPADGEGPVRPVTVQPFSIDKFPVTNELFRIFIETTGYRTEAEQFGWSFVFWSHIRSDRFRELAADRVHVAPWWCKVPGAEVGRTGRSGVECAESKRSPR